MEKTGSGEVAILLFYSNYYGWLDKQIDSYYMDGIYDSYSIYITCVWLWNVPNFLVLRCTSPELLSL